MNVNLLEHKMYQTNMYIKNKTKIYVKVNVNLLEHN